ncbi:MAG: hypothetical protein Kow0059_22260 [Candidatus Sumerlaeia bacterium]
MQRWTADIVQCPLDGAAPLRLTVLAAADDDDVEDGLLECPACKRVFPIAAGVPHLVRDGLRLPERERELAERHRQTLTPEQHGRLMLADPQRPEADARLVAEGRYWSEFFNAYYDAGARAIFDIEARGTHLPFYPYGLLLRDERDRRRPYGFFPRHIGRRIFGTMDRLAAEAARAGRKPGYALDVGCGGGQMGLEAARRGFQTVGLDVAVGAMETGRRHSRHAGRPVNFIYADPTELPFRSGAFQLIVCKDALHHLPGVERAVENLWRAAAAEATFIAYEHIAETDEGRRLRERLHQKYIPRLLARHGAAARIPDVIRTPSPHEDVGASALEAAWKRWFRPDVEHREPRLYWDIEQVYYFAWGRSILAARAAGMLARVWEQLNTPWLRPEFLLLIGPRRPSPAAP